MLTRRRVAAHGAQLGRRGRRHGRRGGGGGPLGRVGAGDVRRSLRLTVVGHRHRRHRADAVTDLRRQTATRHEKQNNNKTRNDYYYCYNVIFAVLSFFDETGCCKTDRVAEVK